MLCFFQAEDGIRDIGVTGVQTCALPIYGGLLELCREVTGGDAAWVPVPEAELLAAGVEPWLHLPLWLPTETARTAWDVDTTRARELDLPSRPLRNTVADTWVWLRGVEEDRKSTRLNSSHANISYAVFC